MYECIYGASASLVSTIIGLIYLNLYIAWVVADVPI